MIAAEITDPTELGNEVFESDVMIYELEKCIRYIRKYIEISSLLRHEQDSNPSPTPCTLTQEPQQST